MTDYQSPFTEEKCLTLKVSYFFKCLTRDKYLGFPETFGSQLLKNVVQPNCLAVSH